MEQKPGQNQQKTPAIEAKSGKKTRKYPHNPQLHPSSGGTLCQSPDNAGQRARYNALSPAGRAERIWRMEAKPPMPREGSNRSKKPRVMAKATAYCDWSDSEHVVNLYRICAVLNELEMGETYCIDHWVPISASNRVCGLHTHTNLRITTDRENQIKGNLFWPDMWPTTWETLQTILDYTGD